MTASMHMHCKHLIKCMCMSNPDKRKANSNHALPQPPLKKLAVDGPMGLIPPMSMPSADGFPAASGESGGGPSSSSGQVSNESSASGNRREIGRSMVQKKHSALAQAWKEDVDVGRLLASLFDLFGERILSFVQPAEMGLFV